MQKPRLPFLLPRLSLWPRETANSFSPQVFRPQAPPSLDPTARAAARHSRDSTGISVGPCSLLAAKDTDKQGSLLPSGCSESGGGYQSVKVAGRGQCHEPQGELCARYPALARDSAVTESAVCAHQTVSRWSQHPSTHLGAQHLHSSCPGCLLSEPSVCFVLICTSNPRS